MKNFEKYSKISFLLLSFWILQSNLFSQKNEILLKKYDQKIDSLWMFRLENPEFAKKIGKEALKLAFLLKDSTKIARTYNLLGVPYRNLSQFDSSYYFFNKALSISSKCKDSTEIAYAYNNIGGYWGFKRRFFLALKNLFFARELFLSLKNQEGLAYVDVQAGNWFFHLKDFERSIFFLNEGKKIREKLNDVNGANVYNIYLVKNYIELKKYEIADSLANEMYYQFVKEKNRVGKAIALVSIGYLTFKLGDQKRGINQLKYAIKILSEVKNYIALQNAYNLLAECYVESKEFDLAKEAIENSKKLKNRDLTEVDIETMRIKLKYYSSVGDFQNYIKLEKRYTKILDSLKTIDKKTQLEEFNNLMELSRIKSKNLSLQKDHVAINFLVVLFVGIFSLIALLLFVIIRLNRKLSYDKKLLQKEVNTKNQFFTILAKDLHIPFTSLLGNSNLLISDFDSLEQSELKVGIRNMKSLSEKLLLTIENLLHWARIQIGSLIYTPSNFNTSEIITDVVDFFNDSANLSGVELKQKNFEELICNCDKLLIELTLKNILFHLLEHTHSGSSIEIGCEDNKQTIILRIEAKKVMESALDLKAKYEGNSLATTLDNETESDISPKLVKRIIEINKSKLFVKSSEIDEITIELIIPKSNL